MIISHHVCILIGKVIRFFRIVFVCLPNCRLNLLINPSKQVIVIGTRPHIYIDVEISWTSYYLVLSIKFDLTAPNFESHHAITRRDVVHEQSIGIATYPEVGNPTTSRRIIKDVYTVEVDHISPPKSPAGILLWSTLHIYY